MRAIIVAVQTWRRKRQGSFVLDVADQRLFERSDRIISVKRYKSHVIPVVVKNVRKG